MPSKAYHTFSERLNYFQEDVEFIDVLKKCNTENMLTDRNSAYVFKNVNDTEHANLARKRNVSHGRKLVINHLRKTIYSSYIKDIYEEVTAYLREIMLCSSRKGVNPTQFIGDHTFKKSAKDILSAGSWDNILRMVTDSIFQSLESERSTLRLLEDIPNRLGLHVDMNIINTAVPYLEIRHFLVHSDGLCSEKFRSEHSNIAYSTQGYVELNYTFILNFTTAVVHLIREYDQKIMEADLLLPRDIHLNPRETS